MRRGSWLSGLAVCFAAAGLTVSSASAAEWGTLKGRLVYGGEAPTPAAIVPNKDEAVCGAHKLVDEELVVGEGGGLANVVIYVRSAVKNIHPDYAEGEKVVLDNKDCRFEPHVLGFWTKQQLVLKNSDAAGHNSNLPFSKNAPINPLIPANGEIEVDQSKLAKAEIVPTPVKCNIHPWMIGYVVVRPDPYFAVTDKDGNFEIKNLPAGEKLEFQVWHERPGYLKNANLGSVKADAKGRFELTLEAGEKDLGEGKIPASALVKKGS